MIVTRIEITRNVLGQYKLFYAGPDKIQIKRGERWLTVLRVIRLICKLKVAKQ